jgi:hypothetical protein
MSLSLYNVVHIENYILWSWMLGDSVWTVGSDRLFEISLFFSGRVGKSSLVWFNLSTRQSLTCKKFTHTDIIQLHSSMNEATATSYLGDEKLGMCKQYKLENLMCWCLVESGGKHNWHHLYIWINSLQLNWFSWNLILASICTKTLNLKSGLWRKTDISSIDFDDI